MDTYMHKTMASIASLEKIEIIRSQEFMPSEVRLKFLKKMISLGPKTAIPGLQFCRILVLGPCFWWSGGPRPQGPLDLPLYILYFTLTYYFTLTITLSIHGNSNMEVLTSNERMSAITIFSLYFDVDQNVTSPSL